MEVEQRRAERLSVESSAGAMTQGRRDRLTDKWAKHCNATAQFFVREGHLTVPRKHVKTITAGGDGVSQAQQDVALKLGRGSTTNAAGPPS
ncbi:hypothetical protein [Streptomyces sp. NPDC058623]|uniref:hypothetical protein n=1 Tax=Streptomyces sp. NPDC058623 TaxID=3346563 RepID=UPI0036664F0D